MGVPTQGVDQHKMLPNFPKNCMKLTEFGPPRGHTSLMPILDLPMHLKEFTVIKFVLKWENISLCCEATGAPFWSSGDIRFCLGGSSRLGSIVFFPILVLDLARLELD